MPDEIHSESQTALAPGQLPEARIDVPGGFKITVPLPKWAVAFLAVLLIVSLVLGGAYWGYSKVSGRVLIPQEDLNDYKETSKHDIESDGTKEAQVITFQDGVRVIVRHFHTDGCVEVLRTSQALVTDKHWLLDLSRIHPPPSRTDSGSYPTEFVPQHSASLLLATRPFGPTAAIVNIFAPGGLPVAERTHPLSSLRLHSSPGQGGCAGRCWNPHPGQFQAWNGAVNGDWVQVWRRWPEGCTHYQWYNARFNVWDTNPDGSPKITWTCCVH